MASTQIRLSQKVTGQERKFIAAVIGEAIGDFSHYTGVPTCAYQISGWTLDKESVLHSPELEERDFPFVRQVLSALGGRRISDGGIFDGNHSGHERASCRKSREPS